MLNILLSDDDKFILELEKQRIREEIEKNNFNAQIACISTDSNQIFKYIESNEGEYLVFLDLDFGAGRLNGIDVARRIKTLSPGSKIVFVTNHQELAMSVLKSGVEPFGFIEKTVDMEKLTLSCKKYIQMAH